MGSKDVRRLIGNCHSNLHVKWKKGLLYNLKIKKKMNIYFYPSSMSCWKFLRLRPLVLFFNSSRMTKITNGNYWNDTGKENPKKSNRIYPCAKLSASNIPPHGAGPKQGFYDESITNNSLSTASENRNACQLYVRNEFIHSKE